MVCRSGGRGRRTGRAFLFGVGLWLAVVGGMGCDTDVTAVIGTERPFSLFGVLNPQLDTQWVRVYSIDGVLQPIPAAPLDAQFSSTVAATGETVIWRDSILREPDGMRAHVFWAPFRAAYDTPYDIAVTRSDGATSSARVRVPPASVLQLPDQQFSAPSILDARILGSVPRLNRVEARYVVRYLGREGVVVDSFVVAYDAAARPTTTGWLIPLNIAADLREFRALLVDAGLMTFTDPLKLARVRLDLIAASADWDPPGGAFDPEILVQPGLLSNVTNGFGFIGAGYRLSGTWAPVDSVLVP